MTIECYYSDCKYHGIHEKGGEDGGPFCFEEECRASAFELEDFAVSRTAYLSRVGMLGPKTGSADNCN